MERVDERDIRIEDKVFFHGITLLDKINSRDELEVICAKEFNIEVKQIVNGVYCYPSWFCAVIDRVMDQKEFIYGESDG